MGYADDKSKVADQKILQMDASHTDTYLLSSKNGKKMIKFKINQVSSHHQKRRFALKIFAKSSFAIGPCLSSPILVLSKRNKPGNKKKEKGRSVSKSSTSSTARKRKRKLNFIVDDDDEEESEEENENAQRRKRKKRRIDRERKEYKNDKYPSMNAYRANPHRFFHSNQSQKEQLVQCLKLCQDTFEMLKARPVHDSFYGFGGHDEDSSGKKMYQCSFCHRFSKESPSSIPHYAHCQIVKVLDVLKGKGNGNGCEDEPIVIGSVASSRSSLNGVNDEETEEEEEEERSTMTGMTSMRSMSPMDNVSMPQIPTLPQFSTNVNYANNMNGNTNNFATALNQMLQNAKQQSEQTY